MTEHQLEVLERQKKEAKSVAFYNALDQSSQDGSTFSLFSSSPLFASNDKTTKAKHGDVKDEEKQKEIERELLVEQKKQREEKEQENNRLENLRKRASLNWRKEKRQRPERKEMEVEEDADRVGKRPKLDITTSNNEKCNTSSLRQMLSQLSQRSPSDTENFEEQISNNQLLDGFSMHDLIMAQDKLTRLLSVMTQQLRCLNQDTSVQ